MAHMKEDGFKIYVEQLRDGHSEQIEEAYAPNFIGVDEKELAFRDPVKVSGTAYLAGDALVLHLDLTTFATIPCCVCNEPVKIEISIPEFYHMEPLEEIKTGIFNCEELLRETILLQAPAFAECNQGKCHNRKEIQKYLAKAKQEKGKDEYHPFADLT